MLINLCLNKEETGLCAVCMDIAEHILAKGALMHHYIRLFVVSPSDKLIVFFCLQMLSVALVYHSKKTCLLLVTNLNYIVGM